MKSKSLNVVELRAKTKDYHNWHGDINGHFQRLVYDENGCPYILTRFKTQRGVLYSAILYIDMFGDLYELISAPREKENVIIEHIKKECVHCENYS